MTDLDLARMYLHDTMVERNKKKMPAEFPFTGGHVQRKAAQRGHHVGETRALRMVKLLAEAEGIIPCGSYRQEKSFRAGEGCFRVTLYRLPGTLLRKAKASVRRRRRVKRDRWWEHPLFGDPSLARHLPGRLRRWREADYWIPEEA